MMSARKDHHDDAPVLFFEASHQGHVAMHVTRMVTYLSAQTRSRAAIFALSAKLVDRLDARTRTLLDTTPGLSLDRLDATDVQPCLEGGAIATGRARWHLAGTLARRHGAGHVFFFLLDTVLIGAIGAGRHDSITRYSGILFRPRLHLSPVGRARGVVERIKALRQYPYYALALSSRRLHLMWTLDPFFPAYAARWLPGARKVAFLSEETLFDAPFDMSSDTIPDAPAHPAEDGRVVFLLYGVLKRRKGILNVLEACARLTPQEAARVELRLMGEVVEEDRAAVRERREALARSCPDLRVSATDAFLSEDALRAEIHDADVILAPYVGHVGSSGVVHNAAACGKALIACREGLIGALVQRYQLGLAVDPDDAAALHAAIVHCLEPHRRGAFAHTRAARDYLALHEAPWTHTIGAGLSLVSAREVHP